MTDSSYLKEVKKDTLPIPPRKPKFDLSPGQVKVQGRIIEVSQEDDPSITLSVKRVMGYGGTTPPVAKNDTLEISLPSLEESLEKEITITAILQYNLSLKSTAEKANWTLVKREN